MKTRKEQLKENMWDLESLYKTDAEWEKAFDIVDQENSAQWPSLKKFKNTFGQNPQKLKECLDCTNKWDREIEKIFVYAHCQNDVDMHHSTYQGFYQRSQLLVTNFQQAISWIEPEILSLESAYFEKCIQEPILKDYVFTLEKIYRRKPHTLSADEEVLMANMSWPLSSFYSTFNALNHADASFDSVKDKKGNDHDLTHGSYSKLLRNPDRTLRENAFRAYHHFYKQHEHTYGENLVGQIRAHVVESNVRQYSNPLNASLDRHNIDPAVYETLISETEKSLAIHHDYIAMKSDRLGIKKLSPWDVYVQLEKTLPEEYSYETAAKFVIDSVAPLGDEYQQVLKKGLLSERWVDRYENKYKRSGAYSGGCYDSYPYILLNYHDQLQDVKTLAHECGHSMHSYLSRKHQPYHTSDYSIFLAEIASTFNEELLFRHLLKITDDPNKKRALVYQKLEDIRATFFRQTMFAGFEKEIHMWCKEGTPITADRLKQRYKEYNCQYFGPSFAWDDLLSCEVFRIPHFYYNFYVYQYATGISAALAFIEQVDKEGPERYIKFLSSGSSMYPLDLLEKSGVSMRKGEPINLLIAHFEKTLNTYKSLL